MDSFVTVYSQAPHARGASRAVLASLMEPVLRAWRTRVAVDPDNGQIVGFCIFERRAPRIAWVQVRDVWRRKGVATALLSDSGSVRAEVETPFMVQRIGLIKHGDRRWESTGPKLVDLAQKNGVTLRFRPYLALELQLELTRQGAA